MQPEPLGIFHEHDFQIIPNYIYEKDPADFHCLQNNFFAEKSTRFYSENLRKLLKFRKLSENFPDLTFVTYVLLL